MKYYGTKNNRDYGFYETKFDNAIEITDEYWMELLLAQGDGKIIIPFENSVIAVDETQYSKENGVWVKLSDEDAIQKKLKMKNEFRKNEIQIELDELDKKRVRALAEPSLKDENTTWLEYYNSIISNLRQELTSLS